MSELANLWAAAVGSHLYHGPRDSANSQNSQGEENPPAGLDGHEYLEGHKGKQTKGLCQCAMSTSW
jgi:hypothetical protein